MRIKSEDTLKCDGCGATEINPIGWVRWVPTIYDTRTDHRTGGEDICGKCYHAALNFLKARRS